MKPFVTGGTGLVLNSHARSKSVEQGVFTRAIGNGTWMKSLKINGERHYLWRASVRLVCLYILHILANLRLTYDNRY